MIPTTLNEIRRFVVSGIVVLAITVLSIVFLDHAVALFAYHNDRIRAAIHALLSGIPGLAKPSNEIPDFLAPLTLVITVLSWSGYFLRRRRGVFDHHTLFFKVVGTAVPLAFLGKSVTKFIFGRVNTRVWVADPSLVDSFHWFAGGGMFNGFPSGHMAVLVPLVVALWQFYPVYRPLYGAALTGLAAALVLTSYHFVSDVIAGGYLGLLVYCFSLKFLRPGSSCNNVWSATTRTNVHAQIGK
jgi:membrane-associated phospholipid phosphatase